MSYVKQKEYKRKTNPYLPIIGLLLAVIFGVIAYFVAPYIVDFMAENLDQVATRLEEENGERNIRIGVSIALWLALMSTYMLLVTMNVGSSLLDEESRHVPPRSNDPKAIKKWEKEQARLRDKKRKILKKLAAEEKRKQGRR